MHSLGIVQWNFTRRDHPGNPGRVSGSGPIIYILHKNLVNLETKVYRIVAWHKVKLNWIAYF